MGASGGDGPLAFTDVVVLLHLENAPSHMRGGDSFFESEALAEAAVAGAESAVAPGARDGVAIVEGAAVAVGDDCAGSGVGVGARRAEGVGGALQAAMSASVAAAMARSGRGIAIAHVTARRRWGQGAARHEALAR